MKKQEIINEENDAVVSKKIKERENKTLFWVLVVIVIIFASVLIPYFWMEASKSFEYSEISWVVEDYTDFTVFHGRFLSLSNPNLYYNIFLRNDPRENDVEVVGTLDRFKYGGVISFSPEVDKCRGDLARVMLDLGAFLKQGIGVQSIKSASSDNFVAIEENRTFATCRNILDRTLVMVDIGEPKVVQDEKNPYCYTIYTESCEDIKPVEKFMVQAVADYRESHPINLTSE